MIPTSEIYLLRGVPLTANYADTLTFETVQAQHAYFVGKQAYVFTDYSYIRDGVVMVENQAVLYKNCNYLMFRNNDYMDKWFYAFITDVEYVADGTTRIYFSVDIIQTWYFEFDVKQCFVEREHVNDDTIGANTLPEPVALGEYVNSGTYMRQFSFSLVLGVVSDGTTITEEPKFVTGIYSGVALLVGDKDFVEDTIRVMTANGLADNILMLYMVPSFLTDGRYLKDTAPTDADNNFPANTDVNGYVPKNNKLLTYPYVGAILTNNEGQTQELKYELFSGVPTFTITGTGLPGGRLIAYPNNYAGGETVDTAMQYSVALGNFPQCPFTVDSYTNWLAVQNTRWNYEKDRFYTQFAANAIGGATRGGVSAGAQSGSVTAGLAYSVGSLLGALVNREIELNLIESKISEEKEVHSINPVSSRNEIGNVSVNVAKNIYGFSAIRRTIKAEYAKVIDDFFSSYGYKVNRIKKPNITGRKSWNYVKCAGAVVTGNAPEYALSGFAMALNKGIRFWHGDYVGDYSRDNSPI